jgi:hypothetical protein
MADHPQSTAAARIIVRIGEDMNWWLDRQEDELDSRAPRLGLVDPRQIVYLLEQFDEYRSYGLSRKHWQPAFHFYEVESEVEDGCLRLSLVHADSLDGGTQFFALPVLDQEGQGPYYDFLDALTAARVRYLNATHHYARDCTVADLNDELDAVDRDRYFSDEDIHVFEEINEILQWSPAEWDDSANSGV